MAKGVEDTAFYRYHRLVSLNEVGGDPGTFGRPLAAFHEHCARLARHWPDTMVTLSTHDTKRSADVRSPDQPAVGDAGRVVGSGRPGGPSTTTGTVTASTRIGPWSCSSTRPSSVRGRSRRTGWWPRSSSRPRRPSSTRRGRRPTPTYDEAVARFAAAVIADADVRGRPRGLPRRAPHRGAGPHQLPRPDGPARRPRPGVPDVYQGTELWDLSLVDPDNRRPVDHVRRADLLRGAHRGLAGGRTGAPRRRRHEAVDARPPPPSPPSAPRRLRRASATNRWLPTG